MSVLINTNSAATLAANNLAASNGLLQRSLNRLSSGSKIVNPADDAGGLAVSMKLSAAAKRQGAVGNNIGNAVSFLQSQDGVLKVTGKVLERISELKTLASDPTKNSDDVANYNAEFTALQAQLTSLAAEKFNGIDLFGSTEMSVATTEDGINSVDMQGVNLMGTAGPAITFTVDDSSFAPFTPSGAGTLTYNGGSSNAMDFGETGTSILYGGQSAYYDGAGNWTLPATNGNVDMSGYTTVTLLTDQTGSTATFTPAGGGDVATIASATDLASVSLDTITGAIQDVAAHRATNGANQSRLGFASEVLSVNKANLEAANSRIIDVDVAEESTQLARYNVLVQAGTSMLAQANQSPQVALRLLS